MGKGRQGSGVDAPGTHIRVRFTWNARQYCETLDKKPTPPNIKYAERLTRDIKERITAGSFRYADFFPDSPHARQGVSASGTLKDLGELWLKTKGRKAAATRSQYANALKFWYKQLGADKPMRTFSHGELSAFIGAHPWKGPRLCNNYLIALRGAFWLAKKDKHIADNPMEGILNMEKPTKLPDPLSGDEAEKILLYMLEHYHEQVFNYFEFAFQTGMRPEEIIALRYSDIDWSRKTARVERARTFRGTVKDVKNHEERDVDLSPRALATLTRQKKFTRLGAETKESDDIFHNPVTGKPWHDERSQREHYWNPALLRSGVRRRRAYATRHTYATRLIMAGFKPPYVAAQMGHTVAVLFSTYFKWINDADKGEQAEKLGAALGAAREFSTGLVQTSVTR